MTSNQLPKSGSLSNRRVAPAAVDASSHGVNNGRAITAKNFKQKKLAAGTWAADNYNYREAIRQFSLIRPSTTTSLYLAGCARIELKHYSQAQKAIADFNECLQLSWQGEPLPFGWELWYNRALAHHIAGEYEEAIEDYTEYIDRCRSSGERGTSRLLRGLIGRGLTYQVLYELNLAMADIDEANQLVDERIPYYLCCRAGVYTSKHKIEKALEDLRKVSYLDCDHDMKALYQRAIVLAELNRHHGALEDLKKALVLSGKPTEHADVCFRSGLSEYALNNKKQAFYWFSRAINLNPFHAEAHYHLGMMQAERKQYNEALKSLNGAHELSPHRADILSQRASVNKHLGKLDDAEQDQKRVTQLSSSEFAIVTMLGNRIKKLRKEIDRTETSPRSHLELAMAYDGLLSHKKHLSTKLEYYKEAVVEYGIAIETDTKNLYPQARVLIALCHQKMRDLLEAHQLHLEFYDALTKHKEALYHWKMYLADVKDKMESGKTELYLDQNSISELFHMEINRRKQNVDEETFKNDTDDQNKNQLAFYRQLRIDLSNMLAAISLFNLDHDAFLDNLKYTSHRVGKIVEALCTGKTSVPEIESILNSSTYVGIDMLRRMNYDSVRMKVKTLGSVGDMTDQLDAAQLVARHICTRYHSQLICLSSDNAEISDDSFEGESSWPFWCCCGIGDTSPSTKEPISSNGEEIFKKMATFAIAFIIKTINSDTLVVRSNDNSAREKDALATRLVLVVSRAHSSVKTNRFSSFLQKNETIPIDFTAFTRMLEELEQPLPDEDDLPIKWNLYEFFHAPGIYYYSDYGIGKIHYYSSHPLMMPHIYGYRLGSREEVDLFKRLDQTNQ